MSDHFQRQAETIIRQIPVMTRMACGFRNVSFRAGTDGDGFELRVEAKVGRANRRIQITLELNDTYTVTLLKIPTMRAKDPTPKTLEEHTDVYCDALGEIVYHACNK